MKLYLSSYRLGDSPSKFADLIANKKRVGVIRNALDFSSNQSRLSEGRNREFRELESIGLTPQEIDLRDYFGRRKDLRESIAKVDALWVTGGNTFILRRALAQSGLDEILHDLKSDTNFAYGGYSAGVCVLTPTLRGIHLVDEPENVPDRYEHEIIWDGLGFLPFCIAPHFRSDHPESEMIERAIEFFVENKMPFVALRDGEALIYERPFRQT